MKQFFITGTSKGIGKAIAEKMLAEGHKVTGLSRSQSIEHSQYTHITYDLSDVTKLVQQVDSLFNIDASDFEGVFLINNAGTLGEIDHLGKISHGSLRHLFDLNVTAPAMLMNAFFKQFEGYTGEKVIINISSGAGKRAIDGWAGYCSSKAALDMFSQVAQQESDLDKAGFKVLSVAPGVVDTQMQTQIRNADKKGFSTVDRFHDLKANNNLSEAEKVAEKYAYIINHLNDFEEVLQDVRSIQ